MDLTQYTVKKVSDFPQPGCHLNYSRPGGVWLETSWLGTGKALTFFYSVPASLLVAAFT